MSRRAKQSGTLKSTLCVAATAAALLAAAVIPAAGADVGPASGGGGPEGALTLGQIKAAFDSAMKKPLADRIGPLETLETQIGRTLTAGVANVKDRSVVWKIKYRTQVALAKYVEAHETFGGYAQSLKQWAAVGRARVVLAETVGRAVRAWDLAECVAIADAALAHWGQDADVAPALKYYKALALSKMNGRSNEALPVLNDIIAEHSGSSWRPKAMRLTAHLQANGGTGGEDAALAMLSLIEQQYAGTWWEQSAQMKPAVILEARQGKPQAALERVHATFRKFPNHKFAAFCRREIPRLQNVVEQQLIEDVLQDIAAAGRTCDRPRMVIVRSPGAGRRHTSLAGAGR